jgi:hypothetical protein
MDDSTWYAANSLEDATRIYLEHTGATRADLADDLPRELSDEEMETTMYVEHGFAGEPYEITFRRALELMIAQGKKFPDLFASTDY